MNYDAKTELGKLDKYYPNSNLKHIYVKHREEIIIILSAIETIWKKRNLEEKELSILDKGIANNWLVVYYYIIGEQINLMIGEIIGIENLLFKSVVNKNWQTRFNTIVIMKTIENKEIKNKIIALGLQDKSKKVLEMVIDVKNNY